MHKVRGDELTRLRVYFTRDLPEQLSSPPRDVGAIATNLGKLVSEDEKILL